MVCLQLVLRLIRGSTLHGVGRSGRYFCFFPKTKEDGICGAWMVHTHG